MGCDTVAIKVYSFIDDDIIKEAEYLSKLTVFPLTSAGSQIIAAL